MNIKTVEDTKSEISDPVVRIFVCVYHRDAHSLYMLWFYFGCSFMCQSVIMLLFYHNFTMVANLASISFYFDISIILLK